MFDHIKILIVEDEGLIAENIRIELTKLKYTVSGIADSYESCLESINKNMPAIVLMDIHIKGEKDGVETAQRIIDEFSLPIVYLTAHADEETVSRARKTGPYGYVVKPFKIEDLHVAIQIALEKHSLTQKLNQAIEDLQSFSYFVSHDLKAPLRHIDFFRGKLSKAIKSEDTTEIDSNLSKLSQASDRAKIIVDSLLNLAQVSGRHPKEKTIDMNLIVGRVYSTLRENAARQDISLEQEDLPPAYGDPDLVAQIWENLIGNSIKYGKTDMPIKIKIGHKKDRNNTVYFIEDNGEGFDSKYSQEVFKTFKRINIDKARGHGIGLSIVQRIINLHKGKIWSQSQPGEGSTFQFYLGTEQNKGFI